MCIIGLRRLGKEVFGSSLDLILQIGQYNYIELFTLHIRNLLETKEYIDLTSEFMYQIKDSESIKEDIENCGIVAYWAELSIKEAEAGIGKSNDSRAAGLSLLTRLVSTFNAKLEESETLLNSILGLINRTCRDDNRLLKFLSLGMMFYLFEFLTHFQSSYAPIVYRTLTFLLVETYSFIDIREYVQQNFANLFKNNTNIPITILIEPYIKRLQVPDTVLEIFDYEFLAVLAQYSLLPLKNAVQLIDIIGKYYLNELTYSKASGVPFTYIASRFIQEKTMQDYLFMFSQYSMNLVITTEQASLSKKKPPDFEEKKQQRKRILDMIS